jgi:hypothetical protein
MDRRPPPVPPEVDEDRPSARDAPTPPIDPATADRIQKSLANPRPPSPAVEAFARVDARIAGHKATRGVVTGSRT